MGDGIFIFQQGKIEGGGQVQDHRTTWNASTQNKYEWINKYMEWIAEYGKYQEGKGEEKGRGGEKKKKKGC